MKLFHKFVHTQVSHRRHTLLIQHMLQRRQRRLRRQGHSRGFGRCRVAAARLRVLGHFRVVMKLFSGRAWRAWAFSRYFCDQSQIALIPSEGGFSGAVGVCAHNSKKPKASKINCHKQDMSFVTPPPSPTARVPPSAPTRGPPRARTPPIEAPIARRVLVTCFPLRRCNAMAGLPLRIDTMDYDASPR